MTCLTLYPSGPISLLMIVASTGLSIGIKAVSYCRDVDALKDWGNMQGMCFDEKNCNIMWITKII